MDNNFEYRVYLKSLSKQFPTIADAATEIINLQAILSLPKGTEHFLTDIHGEYEQFNHVLKNGSGSVRRKIDEEFGNTLSVKDKRSLATLIYYPQEKLELVCQEEEDQDVLEDWFKITIHRLVQMTKRVSSKYTRSKVRKALPHDFSYVIEELITEKEEIQDKELYYNEIINTIIRIGRAPECIIALCNLIQRLVIDHLHIVGDIYDRGKGPHVIMEFGNTLSVKDKRSLATLIYYPQEKLELVCQEEEDQDVLEDWFKITIHRLVQMTKRVSSKYTRSKVRKALPHDFSYVIEELITEKEEIQDKELYYNEIINTIIRIGRAPECIIALCNLIQRLVIDHLHIVGDIYDRGKGPHVIMDTLSAYHSVDIQWGNHDIVWMGAASGQTACMATVLRISARYGNLDTLEEGYGINLIPLATFALKTYENSDCSVFSIKYGADYDVKDLKLDMMMHKAIAIIQFKLEGQLILAHPEYHMDDRLLLDKIDFEKGTVRIGDKEYEMLDSDFPTVDPKDPYRLTAEEEQVVERLRHAFVHCEKLQKHVRFLFAKGSMYKIFNSNLLYHGCVPMDEDGNFEQINVYGKLCSGKKLYEVLETYARKGYYSQDKEERRKGRDTLWYIWAGPKSPVFGKDKMATFERYFIADKETHKETKNAYYRLYDNEEILNKILREFGLDEHRSHIINGHVPVEIKRGETPIKCNGKLLIIDGGFSKAYQGKTGIAGYTLVANSHGMNLVEHRPFVSAEDAIRNETDMVSDNILIETAKRRILVADTDIGRELKESIGHLEKLLNAYRDGILIEKGI